MSIYAAKCFHLHPLAAPEQMRKKTLVNGRMKVAPSKGQMEKKKSGRGKNQLLEPKNKTMVIKKPPSQSASWKKSKMKEDDIKALEVASLLRKKVVAGWSFASGDVWPMEKTRDEIPMFGHFIEHGLTLSASGFFRGFLDFFKLEHMHLNPNSIFQIAVYVHFCEAFLGIRPHWALFRKIF